MMKKIRIKKNQVIKKFQRASSNFLLESIKQNTLITYLDGSTNNTNSSRYVSNTGNYLGCKT